MDPSGASSACSSLLARTFHHPLYEHDVGAEGTHRVASDGGMWVSEMTPTRMPSATSSSSHPGASIWRELITGTG